MGCLRPIRRKCARFRGTLQNGRRCRCRSRRRSRLDSRAAALVPPTSSTAPTTFATVTGHGPRDRSRCLRLDCLFRYRFLRPFARLGSCFENLSFGNFCDHRLQLSNRLRANFACGGCGGRHRNRCAQTGKGFFSLLFPLHATKSFGGRGVPAGSFGARRDFSWICAELELRPWRRECVHITLRVALGDPRWFALYGCAPVSVANRSLADSVSAARTRNQRYGRKSYGMFKHGSVSDDRTLAGYREVFQSRELRLTALSPERVSVRSAATFPKQTSEEFVLLHRDKLNSGY